jgi:hypothetical protein
VHGSSQDRVHPITEVAAPWPEQTRGPGEGSIAAGPRGARRRAAESRAAHAGAVRTIWRPRACESCRRRHAAVSPPGTVWRRHTPGHSRLVRLPEIGRAAAPKLAPRGSSRDDGLAARSAEPGCPPLGAWNRSSRQQNHCASLFYLQPRTHPLIQRAAGLGPGPITLFARPPGTGVQLFMGHAGDLRLLDADGAGDGRCGVSSAGGTAGAALDATAAPAAGTQPHHYNTWILVSLMLGTALEWVGSGRLLRAGCKGAVEHGVTAAVTPCRTQQPAASSGATQQPPHPRPQ